MHIVLHSTRTAIVCTVPCHDPVFLVHRNIWERIVEWEQLFLVICLVKVLVLLPMRIIPNKQLAIA